jgi:hypothetical protein
MIFLVSIREILAIASARLQLVVSTPTRTMGRVGTVGASYPLDAENQLHSLQPLELFLLCGFLYLLER